MASMIPCPNPARCGVKSHLSGSDAYRRCQSLNASGTAPIHPVPSSTMTKGTSDAKEYDQQMLLDFMKNDVDLGIYQTIFLGHNDDLANTTFFDDAIDRYLAGDPYDLDGLLQDSYADARTTQAYEDARVMISDQYGDDDPSEEDVRFVADYLLDHDTTDFLAHNVHNTDVFLRQRMPIAGPALHERVSADARNGNRVADDPSLAKERVRALSSVLEEQGIDTKERYNARMIEDMVDNGPYHWDEDVEVQYVWFGTLGEAAVEGKESRRYVDNPCVALVNQYDGSGYDGDLHSENHRISLTKDNPAFLDRNSDGFSIGDDWGVSPHFYTRTLRNE